MIVNKLFSLLILTTGASVAPSFVLRLLSGEVVPCADTARTPGEVFEGLPKELKIQNCHIVDSHGNKITPESVKYLDDETPEYLQGKCTLVVCRSADDYVKELVASGKLTINILETKKEEAEESSGTGKKRFIKSRRSRHPHQIKIGAEEYLLNSSCCCNLNVEHAGTKMSFHKGQWGLKPEPAEAILIIFFVNERKEQIQEVYGHSTKMARVITAMYDVISCARYRDNVMYQKSFWDFDMQFYREFMQYAFEHELINKDELLYLNKMTHTVEKMKLILSTLHPENPQWFIGWRLSDNITDEYLGQNGMTVLGTIEDLGILDLRKQATIYRKVFTKEDAAKFPEVFLKFLLEHNDQVPEGQRITDEEIPFVQHWIRMCGY